jgi:fumarate reductase flavoprotein subunit
MNMMEGTLVQIRANAVVMATGGAGRVYRYNTNGGIVTGDGMGMALSHGVPLRDMEFVQYHPTGLPGSGILMTEGCRGEGGILVNKNGYRYLQDYGMGPETPLGEPKNKYMELGPRDKVSQAFWHEWRKGNTISYAARRCGLSRPASPGREETAGTSAVHLRTGESLRGRRSGERADSGASNRALHHGRYRNRPAV